MSFNKMVEEDRNFVRWCIYCCIAVISGIVLSSGIRVNLLPELLRYDIPGGAYDTLDKIIYGSVLGGVIGFIQSKMAFNPWSMTFRRIFVLILAYSLLFLFEVNILGSIDELLGAVGGRWLIVPGSGMVAGVSMNWIVWPNVCISSFLHGGLAGIIIGCISKIFRGEKEVGIFAGMRHYFWSFSVGCVVGSLFLTLTVLGMKYFGFKDQSFYIFVLSSTLYWWLAWCLLGVPNWRQSRNDRLVKAEGS